MKSIGDFGILRRDPPGGSSPGEGQHVHSHQHHQRLHGKMMHELILNNQECVPVRSGLVQSHYSYRDITEDMERKSIPQMAAITALEMRETPRKPKVPLSNLESGQSANFLTFPGTTSTRAQIITPRPLTSSFNPEMHNPNSLVDLQRKREKSARKWIM